MFEKEAEEYRLNLVSKLKEKIQNGYNCKELVDIEKDFQQGAEFGFNKANEWHYPSKGEYPKDEFVDEYAKCRLPSLYKRHYCLYLGDDDCVMGKYMRGLFWTVEGQYSLNEIVAWKEIVLPKETE